VAFGPQSKVLVVASKSASYNSATEDYSRLAGIENAIMAHEATAHVYPILFWGQITYVIIL